jgi:hypothetical protein
MRWLTVLAAGFFAATAILALVYGQKAVDHWQSHREVVLGEIKALENDPGYPHRDANLRSAREQVEILDRIALKKSLISGPRAGTRGRSASCLCGAAPRERSPAFG